MRFWRVFPFVACLILAVLPSNVSASSVQVTEESEWSFTVAEATTVYIYGNSNQPCSEVTVDPYLWLYDDNAKSSGQLIAQNDDGNHNNQDQCVSSKIVVDLEPGGYIVRAGYCCRQLGLGNKPGWGDGIYELVILDFDIADPTINTVGATTTLPAPETTTIVGATTTLPPPETTSTISQPPATEVTTTWVPTTISTAPTTTSTSIVPTTIVPATTLAPTTTEIFAPPTTQPPTSPPPTVATSVVQPPSATAPNVTVAVPPATTSPTITTVPLTSTTGTPTTTTIAPFVIPQPDSDAPTELKQQFENQVNVFDGTHDDYVPAGSTVTVAQRRTIVAATVAVSTIMPAAPSRRRK